MRYRDRGDPSGSPLFISGCWRATVNSKAWLVQLADPHPYDSTETTPHRRITVLQGQQVTGQLPLSCPRKRPRSVGRNTREAEAPAYTREPDLPAGGRAPGFGRTRASRTPVATETVICGK